MAPMKFFEVDTMLVEKIDSLGLVDVMLVPYSGMEVVEELSKNVFQIPS